MKTLKLITLLFPFFILVSCKKDEKGISMGNHIDITVQNKQGQNLLSAPATFSKSDINIYHFVNGQPQLYNQPHLDADKGFLLIKDGAGINKMRIFTAFTTNQPTALTLVKFGNLQTDTIKCEYRFAKGSLFLEKVWYNGVLKPREFTVVK